MTLHLSDEELLRRVRHDESDRIERKESFKGDSPTSAREAVCAFANDLPGHRTPGLLVVGMKDDGRPTGLRIDDELLRTLADMRDDGNIIPLPTMNVEKRTIEGQEYAVVMVEPADAPPVRYKGRVYVRSGPRKAIASAQDERVLNERRRTRDLPFDLHPMSSATIDDLQRRVFQDEYLPAAVAPDVLAANERTYEERLASLRMIDGLASRTPTVLGVLVLSARPRDFMPGGFVQFLRIAGTSLADPIRDEESIDGPLAELLRRLDDKIRAHVNVSIDLTSASTERRLPDYPVAALDQLARNAVMHRSYEGTNAPIRVTWFDDRIEIQSPGGPFGLVNEKNFGKPGVVDYRNPTLAEAMKTLGFVQRFGVGIATANRLLRENGNPVVEWDLNDRYVLAIVRRRPS